MYCLSAGLFHRIDDLVHDEIGFRGWRWSDMHGFIRHLDGHRASICIGINDHRFDTESPAGLDHANGYFTPVSNQDFFKHRAAPRQINLLSEAGLRAARESCRDFRLVKYCRRRMGRV